MIKFLAGRIYIFFSRIVKEGGCGFGFLQEIVLWHSLIESGFGFLGQIVLWQSNGCWVMCSLVCSGPDVPFLVGLYMAFNC